MKSMRQLINLMEGVTSVPGIGSTSEGVKGAIAGGALGAALTKSPSGAFKGAQIGSAIQDTVGKGLDYLESLKARAREDSKNGYGQYVNIDSSTGKPYISDWYDGDETVASYENGRPVGISKDEDDNQNYPENDDWSNIGNEFDPKLGENLNEKSKSEKQARFMAASAHDPKFAKKVGIDTNVAKEFNKADTGTKQLSNAMKKIKEDESEMQTAATSAVDSADAEFDAAQTANTEIDESNIGSNMDSELTSRAISMFDQLVNSFVDPEEALNVVMSRFEEEGATPEELSSINGAIMSQFGTDDSNDNYGDFHNDMEDDAYALASAGHGSDEDYGGDDFPMEDINNGYKNIEKMNGDDFFPNGADSPVVKSVGPSGARQGDNPEQKKMEVAETHKELVYSYRKFLKESNIK